MDKHITKSYEIKASIGRVWDALINPKVIKRYFFGTDAVSDWKVGSTIYYSGEWNGEKYQDKGIIQSMIPEKELTISHWSGRSGTEDKPENYSTYSYELRPIHEHLTEITIVQEDHYKTEESKSKAWQHWDLAMEGLKSIM